MTTRITCVSDTHGFLPEIPDCDLLLHSGDILPLKIQRNMDASLSWLQTNFVTWLSDLHKRKIKTYFIFGNHDFIGENLPKSYYYKDIFLEDKTVEFQGLKIYGTPYQKYFGGWAFNLHDDALAAKYDLIPEDTDILLVHNPPYGILDVVEEVCNGKEIRRHCGTYVLNKRLDNLLKLKLCVFGHIHSGAGIATINKTTYVNASIMDNNYKVVNKPVVIDL